MTITILAFIAFGLAAVGVWTEQDRWAAGSCVVSLASMFFSILA